MNGRAALALLLRIGLGGLLAVAGALKLRDPAAFATEIANYQLLPVLAPYLGAALPATEIVVGLGLIALPIGWRRGAALAALALFAAFGAAVASAYFRRIDIACGCFGTGGDSIDALTLIRNAALLIGAVALLFADRPTTTR